MPTQMTPEENEKFLAEQHELWKQDYISQQDYNDAVNDSKVGIKGYTAQLRTSTQEMKKSFMSLGSAIMNGESGAAVFNDSIKSTTKSIGSWVSKMPVLGGLFDKVIVAAGEYAAMAAKQSDQLFENYQQLSRGGLAKGMKDTFENLQRMGYTMKEIGNMTELMKANSTQLANMGGTAAQGAEQFAKAAKEIQFSDIGNQFKRMGMTTDDINNGMAGYIKIQQLSGQKQVQDSKALAESASQYMMEQDKLTKLTGISAQKQNDLYQQALAQEQFSVTQYELGRQAAIDGPKSQAAKELARNEQLMKVMSKYGPQAAAGLGKFLSGSMNSKEAQEFQRSFPEATAMIRQGSTDTATIVATTATDARTTVKNMGGLYKQGLGSGITIPATELIKGLGAGLENFNKSNKEATEQQQKQIAGADEATAAQVDTRNAQRNTTQVADLTVNKGVVPVTKGLASLTKTIDSVTDIFGKLIGREGSIGGEGGGSTTAGAGAAAAGGAAAGGKAVSAPSAGGGSAAPSVAAPAAGGAVAGGAVAGGGAAAVVAPSAPPKPTPSVPPSAPPSAPPKPTPSAPPSAPPASVGGENVPGAGPSPAGAKSSKGGILGAAGGAMVAGMDAIKQMIIRHEGLKTKPYQDSLGLWTVGVGHLIGNGRSLPADMNREFSMQEVMAMFEQDFAHHYSIAQRTPGFDKANETAKGAMVDLAFNMGQWWNKFPATAKSLAAGDFAGAAEGLKNSKWYQQVKGRAVEITSMIAQGGGGSKPGFAQGGVAGGNSGYTSMPNMGPVVSLPNGKTIPVQQAGNNGESEGHLELLSMELDKLDSLVRIMAKQNDVSTKILRQQS